MGGVPRLASGRHPQLLTIPLDADDGGEFLHGGGRLHQRRLLVGGQLDLDDLLRSALSELHGHSKELIPDSVFPLKEDRARQDGFLRRVIEAGGLSFHEDIFGGLRIEANWKKEWHGRRGRAHQVTLFAGLALGTVIVGEIS